MGRRGLPRIGKMGATTTTTDCGERLPRVTIGVSVRVAVTIRVGIVVRVGLGLGLEVRG